MVNIQRKIYLLLFCLFGFTSVNAQTLKAFVAAAENAFLSKDYYSALMYYNDALEFDTSSVELQFQSAEASRLFNAYTPAEKKYQFVLDNDDDSSYPLTSFWLADIKQKKGKYEEAKELFELYLSESEGEKYFDEKAKKEIKACEWAIGVVANPDNSIEINHLGDGINSPYSEFGGIYHNEQLYFSSLRYEKADDAYNPKRLISKILLSDDETTGQMIEGALNNNEMHIAHTALNTEKDGFYYTQCEYVNNNEIRCNLYFRNIDEEGEFGKAVKLPESINQTSTTSTQPNVAFDNKLQKEVLYFVSDREGGKGNLDIWSATIEEDNSFGEVRNLSDLNTYEDDITPFFHTPSQVLYFSSEGYQSLGGFDIFKADFLYESTFAEASHMPHPVNGSYHDIYYTLSDDSELSHFSSNREGSYFLEALNEACCFDIYKGEYETITLDLNALTFDKLSLAELEGARVRLFDKSTGRELGFVDNLEDNEHIFELARDKDYLVVAEKEDYTNDTLEITTRDLYETQTITKKLFLETDNPYLKSGKMNLLVETYDGLSNAALIGSTVRVIDVETGKLVGEQKYNADSNTFNFDIVPGRKYQIIASKNGYDTAQKTFIAEANSSGSIVQKLFLGKGAGSYLPIVLYFDNDIPDIRSVKTYTDKTYTNTYDPYVVKKEEFKNKYSRPLSVESKNSAKQRLEEFFEYDVKGGYGQMNAFLTQLESELASGRNITLTIKGFASPRAASKYNKALSKRRTHSFKNELVQYKGGVLSQYFVNNQLNLNEVPFGEETAPTGISDKISDRRNSIYSVEASKERRIEIIGLNYN